MDYFLNELLIPITEYEIFAPTTKSKLDLDICREKKIIINIPVEIDESILYKYNPYSEYYKDKCYPSSSECGDENTLTERINEFNENYLSLCENNCEFIEYDTNNKRVKCECNIKTNFDKISEILNKKSDLLYHIIISESDTETESNTVSDLNIDANTDIGLNTNTEDDPDIDSHITSNSNLDTEFDEDIECLFKSKENEFCNNSINLQDLIENKFIPLNKKNSIDKVFDLFSKELKNMSIINEEIIEGEDITFQLTTTEKQKYYLKNKLYNNISSIDLGECEKILQEKYQIEDPLIIIKVDIKRNDTVSTQVEYQVFSPVTLEKLELSYCYNVKIDIYPPIDIDKKTYDLIKHLKDQG